MKVDRLVSIIMILLDKERVGAQELAEMFEVSPRTIYRDIDSINLAGIPIRSTPGVGGGFEILPNYKMDKKVFSSKDLSAILMGLSSVSNLVQGNDLVNAMAKVKSFMPADRAKDIEVKASQLHIDMSPWTGNRTIQPYLEMIQTTLLKNQLLSFDYADSHGNKTSRIVEPYQLVLKGGHWYWQGYCLERKDYRLFKLTRMTNLQLLEKTFVPREYQKPQLEFNDVLATMQVEITLRVHRSVMDQVLEYCTYENFSPDGKEYYIARFPFIENDYSYNILLSFGNKCECLEPKHIREGMRRRVQEMGELYRD